MTQEQGYSPLSAKEWKYYKKNLSSSDFTFLSVLASKLVSSLQVYAASGEGGTKQQTLDLSAVQQQFEDYRKKVDSIINNSDKLYPIPPDVAPSDFPITNKQTVMVKWLNDAGYPIKLDKFRYHIKTKRLAEPVNGFHTWTEIRKWLLDFFLATQYGYVPKIGEVTGLSPGQEYGQSRREGKQTFAEKKAHAELAVVQARAKAIDWKLKKDQGRYILKTDIGFEMAARAKILDAGFKAFAGEKSAYFIKLVDGDNSAKQLLERELIKGFHDFLNQYADSDRIWETELDE